MKLKPKSKLVKVLFMINTQVELKFFFDDKNLVHEHDSDRNNHSVETIGSGKLDGGGGLLDVASGDVYNFLKVKNLEPNRDYKFSVSTFSSLKLQQMKQKR